MNPQSARTLALGQSYSLSASDIDFVSNPAMIAELQTFHTTLSYAHQFEEDAAFAISGAIPSRLGVFALSWFRYKIGGLTGFNSIGQPSGTFSFTSSIFSMGYSNQIIKDLYYGINTSFKTDKFLGEIFNYDPVISIASYYPFILSGDVIEYSKIGFLVRDIGPDSYMDYILINENKFILGTQSLISNINVSYFDNGFGNSQPEFAVGLEYLFFMLKFRVGYNSQSESMSYGLGIQISFFQLDYGYAGYTDSYFDSIHRVTIGASIN